VTIRLHAVADNLDAAVLTDGSEGMYRALEAVEGVRAASGHTYLESLVVPYTGNKRAHAHGLAS
jgi:hypothetical protein